MSTLSGAGVLGGLASSTESATNSAALLRSRPWDEVLVPLVNDVTTAVPTFDARYVGATATLAADTTLQTVLSVTGSGILRFCAAVCYRAGYTYSIRLQLVVDGVTIVDETSPTVSDATATVWAVGRYARASSLPSRILESPMYYRSSLVIRAQKSLAITTIGSVAYTNLLAAPFGG